MTLLHIQQATIFYKFGNVRVSPNMSFRILLVVTWVYQYITKSILTHVKNFSNQPHTITFTDFKIDCNDVIAQYIKFNNLKQNWV